MKTSEMESLVTLGLEPGGMGTPQARFLVALLDAEAISKEKGKNPVGWIVKRLGELPLDGWIDQHPFQREKLILHWWPGGRGPCDGRPYERPAHESRAVFSPVPELQSMRTEMVTPERRAYTFSVSEREAFNNTGDIVRHVRAALERVLGVNMPRAKTDRDVGEELGIVYAKKLGDRTQKDPDSR